MGIKFSRYFVSASFYAHFYFYKRKEKKIDKTKRIATEKERRKIMGQRSQIFVRFEKNPGEKEIVARYYKWNCGDQMISIVYHTKE